MTKTILNHIKNKDNINFENSLDDIATEASYNDCCVQNHKYANNLSLVGEMIEKFSKNGSNPNNYYECDKILNQTGFFIRYDNNGTSDFISLNYNYSTNYKANARALYKNGTIQIDYSWAGTVENVDLVLTMQYTKTTDEPFSVDEDIAWTALDSEVDDIINRLGE